MKNSKTNITKACLLVSILLIVSAVFKFPFMLDVFGEQDATNIAASVIDFINHGHNGYFKNLYWLDVVPGYYLYIKLCMKFLNNDFSLLMQLMNYTSLVFGTLIIIPCFFFIKRLFDNYSLAFFTSLTFAFAPAIYRYSIYGFPTIIALFFFVTSLCCFLAWIDDKGNSWLLLSFIALTASFLFRANYVLGSGVFLGLLYMRRIKNKQKIVLTLILIVFSFIQFLLLRHWILGEYESLNLGSTTSISNFAKWFTNFFTPLFLKYYPLGYTKAVNFLEYQIMPIVSGIGIFNFFIATLAIVFFLVKKRYDILIFVISWSAVPTILWLLQDHNAARHNMLSILPFVILIFLFIYEIAPKLAIYFPVMALLGNCFFIHPPISVNFVNGELFNSHVIRNNQLKDKHLIARKIVSLKDNKIIFSSYSLRPYLLYEISNLIPDYRFIKINDFCYQIENHGSITCFNMNEDIPAFAEKLIADNQLEGYTIISSYSSLLTLKEAGYKVIDKTDISSWVDIPHFLEYY